MRVFLAVLTGYAIFAVSAVLLFQLTQRDPHASPGFGFAIGSAAWGMAFAALGGFIAVKISQRPSLLPGILVGCVIAVLALAAIAVEVGKGSIWSELATLLLMAPSAAAGGWIKRRKPS